MRFFLYHPHNSIEGADDVYFGPDTWFVCDRFNGARDSEFSRYVTARAECRMLNRNYYCKKIRREMYKHGEWIFLLACILTGILLLDLGGRR